MSLSDRKKQIEKIQKKIANGSEIDLTDNFDKLVDYLKEHGYDIVKKDYPETTEEEAKRRAADLMETDSPRSATEVERGIKNMARRADVGPEDVMKIWQSQMKNVMERAANSGRAADFAELVEYIKAGHSITNQTQNNNE